MHEERAARHIPRVQLLLPEPSNRRQRHTEIRAPPTPVACTAREVLMNSVKSPSLTGVALHVVVEAGDESESMTTSATTPAGAGRSATRRARARP